MTFVVSLQVLFYSANEGSRSHFLLTNRFHDFVVNGKRMRPIFPLTYRLSTAKYPLRLIMTASNPGIIRAEDDARNDFPAVEAKSNMASGLFMPFVATDVAIAAMVAAAAGFQKEGC